jgi:LacI family transcriptional regulator
MQKGDGTLEGGYRAGIALLDQPMPPTAIFATNDLMALGILEAAADRDVLVPQMLSVVGFDDITLAQHVRPRLTSVAMRKDALAAATVSLVLAVIGQDQQTPTEPALVTPELVIRDSTQPPSGVNGKVVS